MDENGVMLPRSRVSGDCISNAARFQSASLGMSRLDRMPIFTVVFGLAARHVASVIADGRWVMRERVVKTCDEPHVRRDAAKIAGRLWERMGKIK